MCCLRASVVASSLALYLTAGQFILGHQRASATTFDASPVTMASTWRAHVSIAARFFIGEGVTLINADDARERAAGMVQELFDHRQVDAEPRASAGEGSPEISILLRGHARQKFVEAVFNKVEALHRILAVHAEHVLANARDTAQDCGGRIRKRDLVLASVLGADRWQSPSPMFEVDFLPREVGNLAEALAGQNKQTKAP
jgi:hypothetical protein